MSDLEQIISGEEIQPQVEEQPAVEAATEEVAETPTEPTPEPAAPVVEATPEPEPTVPVSVVGGLRQEIRELKAQLTPKPEPTPAPDFYEDPTGAVQHQIAPIQQAVTSTKLEMSRFMAEREFGKEAVDAAIGYFDAHPEQSQSLLNHPSPIHAAVDMFNQQRVASEIGKDPEAWMNTQRDQIRKELEAEMVAKQAKEAAATPAPSMANVTGTGGGPKTTWAGPTSLDSVIGS